MTSPSNYPSSTSAWDAQNFYNAACAEVEDLCSECGKPCDQPTCMPCLEGIAEMIAIMDDKEIEASHGLPWEVAK